MFYESIITSNFSFLRGASHPEELVVSAKNIGLAGISICDRNTLAGVVRAHMAAKEVGLRFQPGCRLVFIDTSIEILAWPKNLLGWNNLCQLLTTGNLRAPKGQCQLYKKDLVEWGNDIAMAIQINSDIYSDKISEITREITSLSNRFSKPIRIVITNDYSTNNQRKMWAIYNLAKSMNLPLLASNTPLYHSFERNQLQDVLTCIREHKTIAEAGKLLEANWEKHLKSPKEMSYLFRQFPSALDESKNLFSELSFSLDELKYQYPKETPQSGLTHHQELRRLALEGADLRYHNKPPKKILEQIDHELNLIGELKYEPYFLTVYDIVRFARSQGILCQGRGSAANSTICYCIGITDVDPSFTDLLFERFISPERREPPDIDVDFEHERREEVIQYIYKKYGRSHSALAATVITYRSRSAIREIGKVFGLSDDAIGALTSSVWGHSSSALGQREVNQSGLDINNTTIAHILNLAEQINGFPRHLSQHVGGFVITLDRLDSIIPVMNTAMEERTQIEWDKDDLEALGILKIDILALGMLTCLRKAFDLLEGHYDQPTSLASMAKEDKRTYAMIQRADTIGVFQIESRAQMSMLPRLKPREFYDLVIEVAIVRPGPIQGDMVHPYLRRRQGKEKVSFPSRELEDVLGRTLGVPLFQEQAMKIAIVAAGFSPGEADKLRRAMATFKRVGTIHMFNEKMIKGMVKKGYDAAFASRCFKQIEGFGEYGFPESHAASFALLVYASCWLKCHYPDVFLTAILNAQPMGFYSPSQLVRDAKEHGVQVLPPDINYSIFDCQLEATEKPLSKLHPKHQNMQNDIQTKFQVRLGFRRIKGLSKTEAQAIVDHRNKKYRSLRGFFYRSGLSISTLERLADADCFRSIGLNRRSALWEIRALDRSNSINEMSLFGEISKTTDPQIEPSVELPAMPLSEHVIQDYRSMSLSLKAHPVSFLRETLAKNGFIKNAEIEHINNNRKIEIAGLVVVRQRPGSAKGVMFMTIEDETGIANVIVWPKVFKIYRAILMSARLVSIKGTMQMADGVTHIIASHLTDLTHLMETITEDAILTSQNAQSFKTTAPADEVNRPINEIREIKNIRHKTRKLIKNISSIENILPKGRNFH